MKPKYFKLERITSDIRRVSEIGSTDVLKPSLDALKEICGFKRGYPVFIGGAPHHGKTEFALELMMDLSEKHGFKWFCYFGEGGTTETIYLELLHKYLQKTYSFAKESQKTQAEYFIDQHFVLANIDMDFSIEKFYAACAEAERDLGVKFDGTCFDPFNDVEEDLINFNGREDKFLAFTLKQVRISSKMNNRIDFIVNHIADVKAVVDRGSGLRYMPPALPNEWAGGRTWWRRAFLMLLVYRPPSFLTDALGNKYADNETHVYCQKAKPKGIAKLGMKSIFWDWKKNRYFSEQIEETKRIEEPRRIAEPKQMILDDEPPF